MNCFILPFFLLFTLFTSFSGLATNYNSAASGFWNNPACWQNGQIPPLLGGDSIFIHHAIMFQQELNLLPATVITINSNASLCGHYQVIIPAGSNIYNYGEFDSDTVTLPGGHLINYSTGSMIVTVFGLITNGGGWTNNGGALQVGTTFTCGGKNIGIAEKSNERVNIYPMPAQNGLPVYIDIPEYEGKYEIRIYSLNGQECGRFSLENNQFIPEEFAEGCYLILIITEENVYREKLLITD